MSKLNFGSIVSSGKPFNLTLEAATQTFAFIARKGAGKTYAAGKLVELLMGDGVQCCILDTVGNWYGLRIAADGKGAGFDVPIFGGLRGDIPLQATAGELIADVVADSGRSVIIDMSQFSMADRKRFAAAFGERLWRRKKAEHVPTPLHLVLEESQLIVPQNVRGDDARMVGVFEEIVRLGRNYGIGVSMISQRPQSVNKEVLNQTECLVVLQVNGSQERKALREWITMQGADVHLIDELPSLPRGTAYIWSPQWLGVLEKVAIAKKTTLDASATPKVGEKNQRRELKALDLSELEQKMAATIEQAKANDPKALKAKIAEAERAAKNAPAAKPAAADSKTVDRAVHQAVAARDRHWKGELDRLEKARRALIGRVTQIADRLDAVRKMCLFDAEVVRAAEVPGTPSPSLTNVQSEQRAALPRAADRPVKIDVGDGSIDKPTQKILYSLAWWRAVGVNEPTVAQCAAIAGYAASGSFDTYLSRAGTRGILRRERGAVTLLDESLAPTVEAPATLDELHARVLQTLDGPSVKIITALIGHQGQALAVADLAAASGYAASGSFDTYLSRLGTRGYIVRARGQVTPTEVLFPPSLV